jgi:hypothetical protein
MVVLNCEIRDSKSSVRVPKTDANWFNPHHVTLHIHQPRGGLFENQNSDVFARKFSQVLSLSMRMFKSGSVSPLAMLSFHLVYPVREVSEFRPSNRTYPLAEQHTHSLPNTDIIWRRNCCKVLCHGSHNEIFETFGKNEIKGTGNTGQLPSN